jgi:ceramide glucosyltransferase
MNRKVSNLVHMLRQAKHAHVIVNDSDIKVSSEYLRNVMARFADSQVGLVTCPYRGVPARSFGSCLESLGIATEFIPGVLTAQYVESGIHFALGSTLAMSRQALQAIGGFESVLNYLADDFELGYRISGAGYKVILAREVVETFLPRYTIAKFFEHQMRWARSTRDSRPRGYRGLALTFGLAWAILAAIVAPRHWWTWSVLGVALAARLSLAVTVGWGLLRDRTVMRHLWLVPLRDLIALGVWAWSYAGDTVTWRGEKFLLKDGRMLPLNSKGDARDYSGVGSVEPGSSQSF